MKQALLLFLLSIPLMTSTALADETTPLRQAVITVKIQKSVFTSDENGMPGFAVSEVCTKKGFINVYPHASSIFPSDLSLVQCDSVLFGQKVSVTIGGAIRLYKDASSGIPLKNAALILSWGDLYQEIPKLTHSASSDLWSMFEAVLAPVATGKIVDNIPQPPEPLEYFSAIVSIKDEKPLLLQQGSGF